MSYPSIKTTEPENPQPCVVPVHTMRSQQQLVTISTGSQIPRMERNYVIKLSIGDHV
jgi:hypothetical protein